MATIGDVTAANAASHSQEQEQTSIGAVRKWTTSYQYESELPIEKLWAVGGDYTNLQKWMEFVNTCDVIGDPTQPGCLRHCKVHFEGFGEDLFMAEKLLALNNEEHVLQYTLLKNFVNFKEFLGTFKIEPATSPRSAESHGVSKASCTMSWSMEVAPVEGKTEEEVVQFTRDLFRTALKGLETLANTL